MKVYELMDALGEMNAGADINVSFSVSEEELLKSEKIEDHVYVFSKPIDDIEATGEWSISLYI